MSRKCQICGKGPMVGNNVSHSNNRTKKRSMPNLQRVMITAGGKHKRGYACTRCIRSGKTQVNNLHS